MRNIKIYLSGFLLVGMFFLTLAASEVSAGGGTACNDWRCDPPVCDPFLGGCNTECKCYDSDPGGTGGYNCGSGYYVCNSPSGGVACCAIGGTTPPPEPKERNQYYGPNCPPNTIINLTTPVPGTSRCTSRGQPVAWNTWWGYNDRYNLGTSERALGCCKQKCEQECWYVWLNNQGVWKKRCEDTCWCTQNTVVQYYCTPTAPPVTTSYTIESTGDSLGCISTAGYVGTRSNDVLSVSVTAPLTYASGTVNDIRVWFGLNSPSVEAFSTVSPQILASNGEWGLIVKKNSSGGWGDIFGPSVRNAANNGTGSSIQSWTRIGTVQGGAVLNLNGKNGLQMVRITNVTVTNSGTNSILNFSLSFLSDVSGVPSYESATSKNYVIFAGARYSNTSGNTVWTNVNRNFNLDLVAPTNDSFDISFASGTSINLAWAFSDSDPNGGGNGLIRTRGDARIEKAGRVNSNISHAQNANYVLGSGGVGANVFGDSVFLWRRLNNTPSATESINLQTNEGGSLEFFAYAFDKACNYNRTSVIFPLGDPWISSKAGIIYAGSGTSFDTIALYGGGSLTERLSSDTYWNLPFAGYKSDTDITTELITTSSPTINNLLYSSRLKSTRLVNSSDNNNKANYWFDRLKARMGREIEKDPSSFNHVVNSGDLTVSGTTSSITSGGETCTTTKHCVVEVTGNLTVNSNFNCNVRTLFVVSGTTRINPDVTAADPSFGCMFLSKGDVTITEGTYKSSGATYSKFDLLNAFVITDGQIIIPAGDSGFTRRDGLKVVGSLIAFDKENGRSFNIGRNLSLVDANSFPTIFTHFDNRYLNFATKFFGGNNDGYKSEVGFKPL